jgi:hypothetical protein
VPDNVCIPFFVTSDLSFRATAPVTGKRFVAPSGNRTGGPALSSDGENVYRMAHAGAGVKAFGVAKYDVASGARGPAYDTPGRVVPVTADGPIAAGAEVEVGAAGKAKTLGTGKAVGLCLTGASDGGDAEIKLY